jgi:23S rRNA (cytidine1920-2'-O)/16S rRNA (cytidine1409-2'-O)-methyltransferase
MGMRLGSVAPMKSRLDAALVLRGLVRSRQVARELVEAGAVHVNGTVVHKPSHPVTPSDVLVTDQSPRYVGRGGLKLEAALTHFGLMVEGWRVLDVGASTGGFTDCLLQHGARNVVAVDVGRGQLAPSLKQDPRVTSYEGINMREAQTVPWTGTFDLCVVDVSFISLRLVLPQVLPWVKPGGCLLALIKPQFEAGPEALDKRGLVRDPADHERAVTGVKTLVADTRGWQVRGVIPCPVRGGDGNQEFLLLADGCGHLKSSGKTAGLD